MHGAYANKPIKANHFVNHAKHMFPVMSNLSLSLVYIMIRSSLGVDFCLSSVQDTHVVCAIVNLCSACLLMYMDQKPMAAAQMMHAIAHAFIPISGNHDMNGFAEVQLAVAVFYFGLVSEHRKIDSVLTVGLTLLACTIQQRCREEWWVSHEIYDILLAISYVISSNVK